MAIYRCTFCEINQEELKEKRFVLSGLFTVYGLSNATDYSERPVFKSVKN